MLEMNEDLFPLAKAPRFYPAPDPPSACTFMRWALKGVGKNRVKLETLKIGGRRYTNRAALARFVAQLTAEVELKAELTRQRTDAYRQAEKECAKHGL